jgi:hypothetical protein
MGYTLYSAEGQPLAGDPILEENMKARADEVHGYITDDSTGQRVYPQATPEGN